MFAGSSAYQKFTVLPSVDQAPDEHLSESWVIAVVVSLRETVLLYPSPFLKVVPSRIARPHPRDRDLAFSENTQTTKGSNIRLRSERRDTRKDFSSRHFSGFLPFQINHPPNTREPRDHTYTLRLEHSDLQPDGGRHVPHKPHSPISAVLCVWCQVNYAHAAKGSWHSQNNRKFLARSACYEGEFFVSTEATLGQFCGSAAEISHNGPQHQQLPIISQEKNRGNVSMQ
ncbi:hypothetical protein B0H13DRAFT_1879705 [Mycena leptocephala]|nr:hypothetical protein B0H13DRAFT_1879705 [Mycena leptocephala]